MKNQKLTYILLPLAAVIWGIIIWKIFFNKPQAQYTESAPITKTQAIAENEEKEIKEFNYNYADPFLKRNKTVTIKDKADSEPKQTRNLNRVVRWPNIQYKGMVANKNKKSSLAMLVIGNKDHLVRKGNETQDIKILAIYPDSISLEYNNDKKYFYLNNKNNRNLHSRR